MNTQKDFLGGKKETLLVICQCAPIKCIHNKSAHFLLHLFQRRLFAWHAHTSVTLVYTNTHLLLTVKA